MTDDVAHTQGQGSRRRVPKSKHEKKVRHNNQERARRTQHRSLFLQLTFLLQPKPMTLQEKAEEVVHQLQMDHEVLPYIMCQIMDHEMGPCSLTRIRQIIRSSAKRIRLWKSNEQRTEYDNQLRSFLKVMDDMIASARRRTRTFADSQVMPRIADVEKPQNNSEDNSPLQGQGMEVLNHFLLQSDVAEPEVEIEDSAVSSDLSRCPICSS